MPFFSSSFFFSQQKTSGYWNNLWSMRILVWYITKACSTFLNWRLLSLMYFTLLHSTNIYFNKHVGNAATISPFFENKWTLKNWQWFAIVGKACIKRKEIINPGNYPNRNDATSANLCKYATLKSSCSLNRIRSNDVIMLPHPIRH